MEFDELSRNVIGCAIEVHRNLGPGLLESTYRRCLACELSHARIPFQMELRHKAAKRHHTFRSVTFVLFVSSVVVRPVPSKD